jgi:hypothetical protein
MDRVPLMALFMAGCGFSGTAGTSDGRIENYRDAPGTGIDAAIATKCYGMASGFWQAWQVCVGAVPTNSITLNQDIDTDAPTSGCLGAQPAGWVEGGQLPSCFIVGGVVALPLGATVHVHGTRALVVVADQTIDIAGVLDGSSHRQGTAGPGIPADTCGAFMRMPATRGGGAGASFGTTAGDGGSGSDGDSHGGAAAAALGTPDRLRAGCNGQTGGSSTGTAGLGGGAVYLLAGSAIQVTGAVRANGSGADGGALQSGGSGAGSGGMIVLYAPSITTTMLMANGGGGASGGDGSNAGAFGQDPAAPTVSASGGSGGGGSGGDGATLANSGGNGSDSESSGGGGGGGGGVIIANIPVPSAPTFSPPVTAR